MKKMKMKMTNFKLYVTVTTKLSVTPVHTKFEIWNE